LLCKNSLAQDLPKTEDVTFVSIKNLWEDAERIQKTKSIYRSYGTKGFAGFTTESYDSGYKINCLWQCTAISQIIQ